MPSKIELKNKKAGFLYFLTDLYIAGIQLYGTEIKSVKLGKASLSEAYCYFIDSELYVKMHISEYDRRGYANHNPRRERKLLLTRRELKKLENKVKIKSFTIIPTRLFISENGYAKLEIALATGKRKYDKRNTIKNNDNKRELDRLMKH